MVNLRVGQGFDIHAFARGRKLILGGVEIAHTHGLLGHSDADVLLHALCDALLGAAGLDDIGHYFPNTGAEWKDISSLKLLELVQKKLEESNWQLLNTDITILAESPKISPYIAQMKEKISLSLKCSSQQIGIKATTSEKLGFVGRKEGIAASAVVLLQRTDGVA